MGLKDFVLEFPPEKWSWSIGHSDRHRQNLDEVRGVEVLLKLTNWKNAHHHCDLLDCFNGIGKLI